MRGLVGAIAFLLVGSVVLAAPPRRQRSRAAALPRYTLTDLGEVSEASEVALDEVGDVLIGVGGTTGKRATFLVVAGKKEQRALVGDWVGTDLSGDGKTVVGYAPLGGADSNGKPILHAVAWTEAGGLKDLTPEAKEGARAAAISPSGRYITVAGEYVAFLQIEGSGLKAIPDGSLGETPLVPGDVNDAGTVVGSQGLFAYRWSAEKAGAPSQIQGELYQDVTRLTGINAKGDLCGYTVSGGPGWHRAFLISGVGGKLTSLPAPTVSGSRGREGDFYEVAAAGLNDAGDVVGSAARRGKYPVARAEGVRLCGVRERVPDMDSERALLWRKGKIIDLTSTVRASGVRGWVITAADAINNRGQILAYGRMGVSAKAPQHIVLLTPTR